MMNLHELIDTLFDGEDTVETYNLIAHPHLVLTN